MPTVKQRKALDKMVENGGVVSAAMRDVGYSAETAKTPQKLTESKGFKELLEEMGLTDELLTKALVEDIEKKPQNRKAELELGFKIKGRLNENPMANRTLVVIVSNESGQRYATLTSTSTDS